MPVPSQLFRHLNRISHMTIDWEFDRERRLLNLSVPGRWPDLEENFRFLANELPKETQDPSVRVLVDLRSVEGTPSESEIREFTHRLTERRGSVPTRRAYLVSDDAHYGIARMTATYAELGGLEARVFRQEDAALAWLLGKTPQSRSEKRKQPRGQVDHGCAPQQSQT